MSKITRMFSNLPIKHFFTLLSLVVLVIPALIASVLFFRFEYDKNEKSFDLYELKTIELLAVSMQKPLYDFNEEAVAPLIEHLLIEPGIAAIHVYDFEGHLFLEKSRTLSSGKMHTRLQDVLYGGRKIGSVAVDFHHPRFMDFIMEYTLVYIALLGILSITLFLFYFFSKIKILAPLEHLKQRTNALTAERLDQPIDKFYDDEVGDLAETFEKMRLSLKGHIDHLDQLVYERTQELEALNKELETRVNRQVEELRNKEHLLVQNAKMAAMGEMIGAIAHQWRQPIAVMGMTANNIKALLSLGTPISDEQLESFMDTVNEQVRHLSQTIDDFKNFFSPTKERKSFIPCRAVDEVYQLIEALMKSRNIPLKVAEHEHFHVFGSPNEFKQVMLNLINNARYAMEERKITDGHVEIAFENNGKEGIIYVRDNAGGIPEELLPDKLFEPYVTTKGENGTGIGLQISKTIIETNMNGSISVQNIDDGAEFIIRLPLAREGGEETTTDDCDGSRSDV